MLPIICIAVSSYLTDKRYVPYPAVALFYIITTLACYAAIYSFPNVGGVYAATVIAASASLAWFSTMWPWRLQTTSRATGSAFSISFVNALGQIGTVIGPQIFRSQYAPRYQVSFAVAMGFTVITVLSIMVTWWVTRHTERETRLKRKQRIAAAKRGETLYEDVDINADFQFRKSSHPQALH